MEKPVGITAESGVREMFKVGNKVTLREGLVVNKQYGELILFSEMHDQICNKVCTVKEAVGLGYVRLHGVPPYWYSDKMLKHASIWTDKLEAEKELELLLEKYAA